MNSDSNMKHHPHRNHSTRRAFTLIELLVVISIIGILAGLLMPALAGAKKRARIVQTQKDMADLKGAISVYQHDYNRLPASTPAAQIGSDFTYGTTPPGTGYGTNIVNNNNVGYQASNAELMVILTGGATNGWTGVPIDPSAQNDGRNPRKNQYFNAKPAPGGSGAAAGAGLGTDGVFRDPWSNPYIVGLDLNYDNSVSNSVYRLQAVSQIAVNSPGGYYGHTGTGNGNNNNYTVRDTVMIFSFGPDGMFDAGTKADAVPNKDNVLSWK